MSGHLSERLRCLRPWPEPDGRGGFRNLQRRFFGVAVTRYPNVAADGERGPVVFNVVVRFGRRKDIKVVYR